ncbi:hypothetical protein C0993_012462 [Termitomyces sp. T159_Od127]|nr:hypothetical protein C0993_012462 [Termitomyces sp. T159_Od127]
MGKKASKQTKKFASSGQLKKVIQARHKHQQFRKRLEGKRGPKGDKIRSEQAVVEDEKDEVETPMNAKAKKSKKGMSVDELLNADFMGESDGDSDNVNDMAEDDTDHDDEDANEDNDFDDDASFASVDDLEEDGKNHLMELSKLAEKDPEFFKYLQENDQELLNFNPNDTGDIDLGGDDDEDNNIDMEGGKTPTLTSVHLRRWQKALLEQRSLRALRKLLIAFRAAAHLNENDQVLAWSIDSSSVYNKLVTTALKYTPVVLEYHVPYKSLANGKFIRIAAFLAIRRLASGTDESIMDHVLKGTYLTLIRSSKTTNVYSLPSINLMKNSASEVFCIDHSTAYQHAFGYIRQLAIHLRNSMKVKTKEAYKQVYNWQYVHCIDFWSIVLARACDSRMRAENDNDKESDLKPLIYPLVQVCLGAIKLISTSRSYPFHLHIIRSLLHLTKHTDIYIPLSPCLVPILTSVLSPTSKPKSSTLRPLDLEIQIRAPQQYVRTRVYYEGVLEESAYLLTEWLASPTVQGSISFPEIVVPVVVLLRKALKASRSGGSSSGKDQDAVKVLLERIEESAKWIEQRRKSVVFAPGQLGEVESWDRELRDKVEDSPLGKYLKVQKRLREKRRKLVEKARAGEDEILDD